MPILLQVIPKIETLGIGYYWLPYYFLILIFIFEYIRSNFKKSPIRTNELIRMMNSLPYIHPYLNKRAKLIDFKEKFELNRESMNKWLLAFCIIINSK